MKTLFVSLAALVAVSGAALASDRSFDLRDSDTYFGKYSTKHGVESYATDSNAFAVVNGSREKPTTSQNMNFLEGESQGGDGWDSEPRQSNAPAKL